MTHHQCHLTSSIFSLDYTLHTLRVNTVCQHMLHHHGEGSKPNHDHHVSDRAPEVSARGGHDGLILGCIVVILVAAVVGWGYGLGGLLELFCLLL